ncbi:MAG: N-acetylmuramic acid 6-phosphate etherase [Acidobacteriota bacterium]|nr:N-acetylmuramic acid 6-phosphate etherase [Acidobacteriota bacterium]
MPTQMQTRPITERVNPASRSLERKSLREILQIINREDQKVARAVAKVIPEIAKAAEIVIPALAAGGRLVYIGAGTSGRLGALDAAECLPTFGTTQVTAVLAGGPRAMLTPAEGAEDDTRLAVLDLKKIHLRRRDVLMAISASGRTPYACEGLRYARRIGAKTIALTSNPGSPLCGLADVAIVPVTGPEVVAGSTRMKSGTAQKLVLNMLSTACMVRLGKVYSGLMVGVQLTNHKLRERAEGILMQAAGASRAEAQKALADSDGKLPVALVMISKRVSADTAERMLRRGTNLAALLRERGPETRKRFGASKV